MNSTLAPDTPPRELCSRRSDGIEVSLLWTPGTEELRVTVLDLRSNRSFDLPVDGRQAMQVFHHPYPYAAECGVLDTDPETEPSVADVTDLEAEELAP